MDTHFYSGCNYVHVHVETEINDEACVIIDELKFLVITDETEEYLPFKKVGWRKLIDITKKVIAVIRHIEADDITQTKKLAIASFFGYSIAKHMHTWRGIAMHTLHTCHSIVSSPLGCKRSRSEERQKRREKRARLKRRIEIIANLRMDINRLTGKDKKLEGNEIARLKKWMLNIEQRKR